MARIDRFGKRVDIKLYHPIPVSVRVIPGEEGLDTAEGELTDISVRGLGVVLPDSSIGEVPLQSRATVVIETLRRGGTLTFPGKLVRNFQEINTGQQLGIQFDRTQFEAVNDIQKHQRVLVEIKPFGWLPYRHLLTNDE